MNPYKDIDLSKIFDSFSKDEIEMKNNKQEDENDRVYADFSKNLVNNRCFLCGLSLDEFVENNPCFHWFTYPQGIKKKHFEKYLNNPIGFFQLDSYFRWLANFERPLGNINDLKDEISSTSFIEATYKYKNIEWAFSIGKTDYEGHKNAKIGTEPHYHIQMKVNGNIFLKFNDFHIPFSDGDLFNFELFEQLSGRLKLGHSHGMGMSILEDDECLQILDENLSITDDFENAPFSRQTMIIAPEGETISGELIMQAMLESKNTKEPVSKILQKYRDDLTIHVHLSPGLGMSPMTKRSGKK